MAYQTPLYRKLQEKAEEISQNSSERLRNGKCNRKWSDEFEIHLIEEENRSNCGSNSHLMTKNFPESMIKLIFRVQKSILKLISASVHFNKTSGH